MNMKYVVASIIGAIIGYITNWLAIKMLFRPYTQKTLFGIKIPFTPGLVPKEKTRIAKSVGSTIGKHILDERTLVNFLTGEKINNQIDKCIKKEIIKMKNSDKNVEQKLYEILGDKYSDIKSCLKSKIIKYTVEYIGKQETKQKISRKIEKIILEQLKKSPDVILDSEIYKNIKVNFLNSITDGKNSQEIAIKIEKLIKDKIEKAKKNNLVLKEVVPSTVIDQIRVYIYNNSDKISCELKNVLNEQDTKASMKKAIGEMLNSNLNPMIAMFVNNDSVCNKVIDAINSYLDDEKNQKDLVAIINQLLDNVMSNKVEDFIDNISDEVVSDNINKISKVVSKKLLSEQVITYVINLTENKIKQEDTILKLINKDNCFNISNILTKKVDELVKSSNVQLIIKEFIDSIVNKITDTKIKSLVEDDNDDITRVVLNFTKRSLKEFVKNKGKDMVKVFNVSEIIEKKINSFDVDFAEEIILEIANKELKAITWLGAFLGSIMGLLSPLLNRLW